MNPFHKPAGHHTPEIPPTMPTSTGNRFRLMFGLPLLPESVMKKRISKIEYCMKIAEAAACRSEDPFYQVGAAAMSADGRIVATGYNGLPPGVKASPAWWNDKEKRKPYVIHAEANLCSMFKRGEVQAVCVTLMPCMDCMRTLAAHGVKEVYFQNFHESSLDSVALAGFWGMHIERLFSETQSRYSLKEDCPHRCDGGQLNGFGGANTTSCPHCCPEDFPKEPEVPAQYRTCRHGTAFRYSCPECDSGE